MSEENTTKPQGKGLAVSGFVIALVGLVLNLPVMAAAVLSGSAGTAYFWVVLCLAGLILSIMGMIKLGKTGGKRGLAIAGLVIGIVASVWSVSSALVVGEAADQVGEMYDNLDENALNDAFEEALKNN
jgi:hypothetical protein